MATGKGRSEEMAELLELPLQDSSGSSADMRYTKSGQPDSEGRATRPPQVHDGIDSEESSSADSEPTAWPSPGQLAIDLVASIAFWYVLLFAPITEMQFYVFLAMLLGSMIAFRVYRAQTSPDVCGVEIPYTCGYVPNNGKELFLVATIHISPRAPRDVEAVIDKTLPDVAMIELDDERLSHMHDVEAEQVQEPKLEDLQQIKITEAGGKSSSVYAQRALWNAERAGENIRGTITFDDTNEHGARRPEHKTGASGGKLALVRAGAPVGEFAPSALKAHMAAAGGAEALLVINKPGKLPVGRIGGSSLTGDLRIALKTCSCGFPPIPVLLLPNEDGERLLQLCNEKAAPGAELQVMEDHYPRRTLRRRLCQAGALIFSGIGVLYGIIQCFDVEVGAEFLAAESAASARGIPCTCIDVDLNRFWSRLGMAVIPTPCNLLMSLWSWLCFPRVCFQVLFPPKGNVDVMGSMVLHAASFPLRTWVAFILAGFCASFITKNLLKLLGFGVEQVGEGTGAVSKEDRDTVQTWIILIMEMYLMPQIYAAVAASRDEAMYRSIVEKSHHARRLVVVVGAGHANGILQRARQGGL